MMTPHAMDRRAPTPRSPVPPDMFWQRVAKGEGDDCWEWIGAVRHDGYGEFQLNRERTVAHRASWALNRFHPGQYCVLHRCDNKLCVRPDHLFLGDPRDNVLDMVRKQRQARGERNNHAGLSEAKVREIRAAHASERIYGATGRVARRFGITEDNVRDIVYGRTWRHVS